MKRSLAFTYGIACHLLFLATFAYMACFTGDLWVPKTIDAEGSGFSWSAVIGNSLLIALFAIQHSVMARPGFKRWWTRFVPTEIERSTYVLASNVVVIAIMWLWQPIGPQVWQVQNELGRALLYGLFATGWLMVPVVSLLINHFDLFGIRQVWLHLRRRPYTHLPFATPGIYRYVRHPLYVGWIIAFWATPSMSVGHLLLAASMTVYMLIAIPFEERDLVEVHGEKYRTYREQVPGLIPKLAGAAVRRAEGAS
jgi:protein-S-isoprenylcysteine O-methyltransferase Ste14